MRWRNLLSDQCPKCGSKLNLDDGIFRCALYQQKPTGRFDCDFIIMEKRYNEVRSNLSSSKFFMEVAARQNDSDLNNYGRKKMSDDFGDSPFLNV